MVKLEGEKPGKKAATCHVVAIRPGVGRIKNKVLKSRNMVSV
jgi:hypothetical protein